MTVLGSDVLGWVLLGVGLLLAVAASAAIASRIAGARVRALREEFDAVAQARRNDATAIQRLEARVGVLERQSSAAPAQPAAQPAAAAPASLPAREARRPASILAVEADVLPEDALTAEACLALTSLAAFRHFAAAVGGGGMMLRAPGEALEWNAGADAASTADLWAVQHAGRWLIYPGFNLRRAQSALLSDSGRMARDRLGWVFDIVPGDQLAAERPATMAADGQITARGLLRLPL